MNDAPPRRHPPDIAGLQQAFVVVRQHTCEHPGNRLESRMGVRSAYLLPGDEVQPVVHQAHEGICALELCRGDDLHRRVARSRKGRLRKLERQNVIEPTGLRARLLFLLRHALNVNTGVSPSKARSRSKT